MPIDLKYGRPMFDKPNNLGENEPVFILRGNDILAVSAIHGYIKDYRKMMLGGDSKFLSDLYLAVNAFEEWERLERNHMKLPD